MGGGPTGKAAPALIGRSGHEVADLLGQGSDHPSLGQRDVLDRGHRCRPCLGEPGTAPGVGGLGDGLAQPRAAVVALWREASDSVGSP